MAERPGGAIEADDRAGRDPVLRAILADLPSGVLVASQTGSVLFANPAAASLLGVAASALLGSRFEHPLTPGASVEIRRDSALGAAHIELRTVETVWNGEPALLASLREVGERRRLEAFRIRQAAILEQIAGGAPLRDVMEAAVRLIESQHPGTICTVLTIEDGKRLRHGAAPGMADSFRAAVDGLEIGRTVGSCGTAAFERRRVIVADIETDPLWDDYRELARAHRLRACWSQPIIAPDGRVLGTFAVYGRTPRTPEPGELDLVASCSHMVGVAIERRRLDEERAALLTRERAANEALRAAQRMAKIGSWVLRFVDNVQVWSDELFRILGVDPADFVPTRDRVLSMVHPDDRAQLREAQKRALQDRTPLDVRYRVVRPDGEERHVHERAEVQVDDSGRIVAVAGTVQDVTERARAERELTEARGRLMDAIHAIPGSFRLYDKDERIVLTNDFRWTLDARLPPLKPGTTFEQVARAAAEQELYVAAVGRPEEWLRERVAQFRRADTDVEVQWTDGHWHHLLERRTSDGGVVTLRLDITRRKNAELALRERDARMRELASLLDKARDAIIVRNLDHSIRFWNKAAERMYGWSADEVVGRSIAALLYDDPSPFEAAVAGVLAAGEWTGILRQRRKDGGFITVEGRWTLVRDETGAPSSIMAINTDITDRMALEEQLQRSRRLESLGQLTGGVAHDFNNLLTVILGHADLLLEEPGDSALVRSSAGAIEHAAGRAAELTQQLLAFARRQALQPADVDLNALVTSLGNLLRRTLGEHIEIDAVLAEDLWLARIDRAQMESALLNLCVNARDAMPGGGRLLVETCNAILDADYARREKDVAPGEYAMVSVRDWGQGMTPDVLARAFEPFFTTKEVGKGTGLGLSMVYGFVKQSNGHVAIDSEPGRGATVRLYLPRSAAQHASGSDGLDPKDTLRGGDERILVVEDDRQVRTMVVAHLASLGYRTAEAAAGAEALSLLEADAAFDLVLTDVVMPGALNGKALADAVSARWPGMRVVFMSGYTENAIVHHGRLDPGVRLLGKPFRKAELAVAVRDALDAAD